MVLEIFSVKRGGKKRRVKFLFNLLNFQEVFRINSQKWSSTGIVGEPKSEGGESPLPNFIFGGEME